ncbi:MAG: carboxypeptidase regulatory-like domain-containing protein [Acidobacteria bacterium]|nr:carboxypeptidase regulatory-like domain-containing protein [Acidobacteriota bacterium]
MKVNILKNRLSVLFLVLFAAPAAFGCAVTETGVPACAYWTRADAVFYGKALRVESAQKSEDLPDGARKIRFQVLQNFKGADNPTFSLVASGGAEAGVKSGQTWIVYAHNDIVLKSFAAFRAVRVDPKTPADELESLRAIVAGKTSTAIAGRIVADENGGAYTGAPVEVYVEGKNQKLSARTGADGAFEIPVPTDGNYRVELRFPFETGLVWPDELLGANLAKGSPTVFKYEVRLNDGDCSFGFFRITK